MPAQEFCGRWGEHPLSHPPVPGACGQRWEMVPIVVTGRSWTSDRLRFCVKQAQKCQIRFLSCHLRSCRCPYAHCVSTCSSDYSSLCVSGVRSSQRTPSPPRIWEQSLSKQRHAPSPCHPLRTWRAHTEKGSRAFTATATRVVLLNNGKD